jgi:CheY-specific phosphatase CheX
MNQIQQEFQQAFTEAAVMTFQELCGFKTQAELITSETESPEMMVIAGLVGVTESSFEGSMSIGFSEVGFLETMEKMLGEKHTEVNREIEDGAAEFANIIFGQAKVKLNEKNHQFKPAIPCVIRAEELNTPDQINVIGRYLLRLPKGVAFLEISGKSTSTLAPEIAPKTSETTPKLDGQVLLSFVDGVREAFETQCHMKAEALQPYKRTQDNHYQFDIGSIIGITGASFRGTLSIAFEASAYLEFYYRMTNERHDFVTAEIADGASEMINIIYGITKKKLNEQGYGLQMALPKLVQGAKMEMHHGSKKPAIAVPFIMEVGKVWVEFAFEETDPTA